MGKQTAVCACQNADIKILVPYFSNYLEEYPFVWEGVVVFKYFIPNIIKIHWSAPERLKWLVYGTIFLNYWRNVVYVCSLVKLTKICPHCLNHFSSNVTVVWLIKSYGNFSLRLIGTAMFGAAELWIWLHVSDYQNVYNSERLLSLNWYFSIELVLISQKRLPKWRQPFLKNN